MGYIENEGANRTNSQENMGYGYRRMFKLLNRNRHKVNPKRVCNNGF
jgi:hypothetical protein